jgi:hypothetical protein
MPQSPPGTYPLLPSRRKALKRIIRTRAGEPSKWAHQDGSRRVWSMTLAKTPHKTLHFCIGHLFDFMAWHPGFSEDAEANGILLGVEYWEGTSAIPGLRDKETFVSAFAESRQPLLDLRERWIERLTDFGKMFRTRKGSNWVTDFRGRTQKDNIDHYFHIVPIPNDFDVPPEFTKITEGPLGMRFVPDKRSSLRKEVLIMDLLDATAFRLSGHENFQHLISNGDHHAAD